MFNLGNLATYPNGTGYLFVTGKDSGSFYRGTMASGGFATEQSASRAGGLSAGRVEARDADDRRRHPGRRPAPASCTRTACSSRRTTTSPPSRRSSASRTARRRATSSAGRRTRETAPSRATSATSGSTAGRSTPADAATLSAKTSTAATDADKAALTLGDTSAVTDNLTLPVKGSAGSTITWASSKPATVSSAGAVTRPAHGAGNAVVTLTATITHGAVSTTKDFQVTVLEDGLDDAGKVQDGARRDRARAPRRRAWQPHAADQGLVGHRVQLGVLQARRRDRRPVR